MFQRLFILGFAILTIASHLLAGDPPDGKSESRSARLDALGGPEAAPRDVTVAAKPGGGITIDAGDDFSLNLANRLQVLWRFEANDAPGAADVDSLSIRRARTKMQGHVWGKDKTYHLQLDWTSSKALLDGWFEQELWKSENDDAIALRVGQMKPRHGRQFENSSETLEHTERSLASDTFSGRRIVQARVHGQHLEGGKLNWAAGIGNSDPSSKSAALESGNGAANVDNEVNYMFDVRFDPMGALALSEGDLEHHEELKGSIGAGLVVGNHRTAATAPDVETTSININTAWKVQGFFVFGEAFLRTDDVDGGAEADSTGWTAQASYTLPPPEDEGVQWSFAVRYSMVDFDDAPVLLTGTSLGTTAGEISEIGGTISAYYHAHKLKTQLGYRHQTAEPAGGGEFDQDFVDVLFQVVF